MRSSLLEEGTGAATEASTHECEERFLELQRMIRTVALEIPLEPFDSPPKLETHRDFLLKEMSWMAADFEVERQFRCPH